MFNGIHDLGARDTHRDWSKTAVKTDHFDHSQQPVTAYQNAWELAQMVEIYCAKKPIRVLELGPYHGGVLYHWIKNTVPGAKIAAVDYFDELLGGLQAREDTWNLWAKEAGAQFTFFQGDTRDPKIVDTVYQVMGWLDWLFIDATHDYDCCRADFENYGSMVKPGGTILFHDIRPRDMGSYRLFTECQRAGYVTQELVADPEATEAGVGIVYL